MQLTRVNGMRAFGYNYQCTTVPSIRPGPVPHLCRASSLDIAQSDSKIDVHDSVTPGEVSSRSPYARTFASRHPSVRDAFLTTAESAVDLPRYDVEDDKRYRR